MINIDKKPDLIDKKAFIQFQRALGKSNFSKIYDQFTEEMDSHLNVLLVTSNNEQSVCLKFSRIAHRLAGSCAIFGAHRLHDILIDLENDAKIYAPSFHKAEVQNIIKIWQDTRIILEKYIQS